MAKVVPGPVASDLRGSIGPVTYYRLFGQLVVRARVRPHQKISSGRYWSRHFMKWAMALWGYKRFKVNAAWTQHANGLMHGVNSFVQANYPETELPLFMWPPHSIDFPHVAIYYQPYGQYRRWEFHWDPADYPAGQSLLMHAHSLDTPEFGWLRAPVEDGYYQTNFQVADWAWYICMYPPPYAYPYPQVRQFQRTLFEDCTTPCP